MNPVFVYIYVIIWFFISILTFILYKIDKEKSKKGQFRIKERDLLLCTIALGSIGGLMGLYIVRHKTKHWYFVLINWLSFITHCYLLYYIFTNVGAIV